ncbi:amidohydrolase family protein, partial [bacterium]|nr:amidohydrolase family protein [bacterium]
MKIDIFAHIFPKKYINALSKKKAIEPWFQGFLKAIPTLTDLDLRLRIMDQFNDLVQVLMIGPPYVEATMDSEDAVELSKMANDEMAELVAKYPDRFVTAVARLPMNNLKAALKETDRAIDELKFKGIELPSDVKGEPLDLLKFRPL